MNKNANIVTRPSNPGENPGKSAWMSVHLAGNNESGASVIIFPGGGYVDLADQHEGIDCANWLNSIGVSAFVLRYRLAPEFQHPYQLQDAQWAIRHVRENASGYNIDANKIGVWGFSAGGHLAATASTHYSDADESNNVSSRPDFSILSYPVISFAGEFAHSGSRNNLIGTAPDPNLVENLSNERQVNSNTPPAFLFHTDSDNGVSAENSVLYYLALRKAGVPAELHIFQDGPHGVGLAPDYPVLSKWKDLLKGWLITRGLI